MAAGLKNTAHAEIVCPLVLQEFVYGLRASQATHGNSNSAVDPWDLFLQGSLAFKPQQSKPVDLMPDTLDHEGRQLFALSRLKKFGFDFQIPRYDPNNKQPLEITPESDSPFFSLQLFLAKLNSKFPIKLAFVPREKHLYEDRLVGGHSGKPYFLLFLDDIRFSVPLILHPQNLAMEIWHLDYSLRRLNGTLNSNQIKLNEFAIQYVKPKSGGKNPSPPLPLGKGLNFIPFAVDYLLFIEENRLQVSDEFFKLALEFDRFLDATAHAVELSFAGLAAAPRQGSVNQTQNITSGDFKTSFDFSFINKTYDSTLEGYSDTEYLANMSWILQSPGPTLLSNFSMSFFAEKTGRGVSLNRNVSGFSPADLKSAGQLNKFFRVLFLSELEIHIEGQIGDIGIRWSAQALLPKILALQNLEPGTFEYKRQLHEVIFLLRNFEGYKFLSR